jgi:hypothetical protein
VRAVPRAARRGSTWAFRIYSMVLCHMAACALIMISILAGFDEDQYAFKVHMVTFTMIVLFALEKSTALEFLKLTSDIMLIIAPFYKTTINED